MQVAPSQVVKFIDNFFPTIRTEDGAHEFLVDDQTHPVLLTLADFIDGIPEHILARSTAPPGSIQVTIRSIRSQCDRKQNSLGITPIPLFGNVRALQLLREAIAELPDEVPAPGLSGLEFLAGDQPLRESLATDLTAVHSALINAEWKAATVLAGSLLEALLLWAIKQVPQTERTGRLSTVAIRNSDPLKWELGDYITAARELDLISEDTHDQANLARGFRNLIHPGRAERLGQKSSAGTSYAAIAAVELTISDLTASFSASHQPTS